MSRKPKSLPLVSDQIRSLIQSCGITRYEIAKRTGIDQSALTRFMSGERGLSTPALDTLGELLGLKVVMCDPKKLDSTSKSSK